MATNGRELRSTAREDGTLELTIADVIHDDPAAGEVLVRIEAAPINPSDLGLLLGPADIASLRSGGTTDRPTLSFDIPASRRASVGARVGQSLSVGNEGAGTVIAAGEGAEGLLGKRVAMLGGAMFADYRTLKMRDVVPLPGDASAADGASMFVNPLTALGFVETMRRPRGIRPSSTPRPRLTSARCCRRSVSQDGMFRW